LLVQTKLFSPGHFVIFIHASSAIHAVSVSVSTAPFFLSTLKHQRPRVEVDVESLFRVADTDRRSGTFFAV